MIKTENEALQMTEDLWLCLADNPDHEKRHAVRELGMPIMTCECPCCEYTTGGDGAVDCTHCPLGDFFEVETFGNFACEENPTSSYAIWQGLFDEDEDGRREAAMEIAVAARKARLELEASIKRR